MEAYTGFAQVYDVFMDDTPYEEWCDHLVGLLALYEEQESPSFGFSTIIFWNLF